MSKDVLWIYANLLGDNGNVLQWFEPNYTKPCTLDWTEEEWNGVHTMHSRLMETVRENAKKHDSV